MTPIGHDATVTRLIESWRSTGGPHGWILAGPEGIGKGLAARAAIRGHFGISPEATHPDMFVLEPSDHGGATVAITVDDVRALAQQLRLTPARGGRRIALIDPADAMTESAANALLKILEEPPPGAVLVLIAHALGTLPETLRSRCAIERCALPDPAAAAALVATTAAIEADAAARLLALADGSPGLAVAFAASGAQVLYAALVETLSRPTPFERSGLQAWAEQGAKLWPVTARLVAALLHRTGAKAAGAELPTHLFDKEAALIARLAANGLEPITRAFDLVGRIARDTAASSLDTRYAGLRLLLALEHVFTPAIRPTASLSPDTAKPAPRRRAKA